ncbi:MAG: hypothetical protein O3B73_10145 [bacterium]|nr:hypothetical protein [bacterium]
MKISTEIRQPVNPERKFLLINILLVDKMPVNLRQPSSTPPQRLTGLTKVDREFANPISHILTVVYFKKLAKIDGLTEFPPIHGRNTVGFLDTLRSATQDVTVEKHAPRPEPPRREGKPLHIYSRILNEAIWVVPDGFQGHLDGPVYSDSEVRELDRANPTPEELRRIHAAKVELDGEVVAPEPEYGF